MVPGVVQTLVGILDSVFVNDVNGHKHYLRLRGIEEEDIVIGIYKGTTGEDVLAPSHLAQEWPDGVVGLLEEFIYHRCVVFL